MFLSSPCKIHGSEKSPGVKVERQNRVIFGRGLLGGMPIKILFKEFGTRGRYFSPVISAPKNFCRRFDRFFGLVKGKQFYTGEGFFGEATLW